MILNKMADMKTVSKFTEITPTFGLGFRMNIESNNLTLYAAPAGGNTVKENGKPSSNNCTCNMYNICVYNGQQTEEKCPLWLSDELEPPGGHADHAPDKACAAIKCDGSNIGELCKKWGTPCGEINPGDKPCATCNPKNTNPLVEASTCGPNTKVQTQPHIYGFFEGQSNKWSSYDDGGGSITNTCLIKGTTSTYFTLISWDNFLLGNVFYGSRINNLCGGASPTVDQDYKLEGVFDANTKNAACNKSSTASPCPVKNNWCDSLIDPTKLKTSKGWVRGQWTFPVTTQMTGAHGDTQDTLIRLAAQGKQRCLNGTLTTRAEFAWDPSDMRSPPPLLADNSIGLIHWLDGMLSVTCPQPKNFQCDNKTIGTINPSLGFIRDYMIIKTFASVYCATLYGYIDPSVYQNNLLAVTVRENWLLDNNKLDGGASQLLDVKKGPFGPKIFADAENLKYSYQIDQATLGTLPFLDQLSRLVVKNNDMFTVSSSPNILQLTLPIDGFRMKQIRYTDGTINPDSFNETILKALFGCFSNTTPTQTCALPTISKMFKVSYGGISYTSPPFSKTTKTNNQSYSTRTFPYNHTQMKSGALWPPETHAWVDNYESTIIEAFYYVTTTIESFNGCVGLAAMYLATVENLTAPEKTWVLTKIVNETSVVPTVYLPQICSSLNTDCANEIKVGCEKELPQNLIANFPSVIDTLLFKNANNHACQCYNSNLRPPGNNIPPGDPSALCFDSNCNVPIPGSELTLSQIFNLTDENCKNQCAKFNGYKDMGKNFMGALDQPKYERVCGGKPSTFNIGFLLKLLPLIIITPCIILLAMGINTPSIIIASLTLLTLTGVSIYLAKLFTPLVGCFNGTKPNGQLPNCVSMLNNNMDIPLSFCDINMFCECPAISTYCGDLCDCGGDVCIPKDDKIKRETETIWIKMVNVEMVIFSSCLLVLLPILLFLLRKRFLPQLPLILTIGIVFLTVSICGTVLYLSIAQYKKPRLIYKDFTKYCVTPTPAPTSKSSDE